MSAKLLAAIEIFKALGWENLTDDNVLQLPVGTVEQRKIALQGLQKGEWEDLINIDNSYKWEKKSIIDVELYPLALFAIRIGISASRTSQISYLTKDEMTTAQVIATRGADFIEELIRHSSKNRIWTHSTSLMAGVNVYLVHNMGLDIPRTVDYLKDWVIFAGMSLGLPTQKYDALRVFFPVEILKPRILEHILLAVELGLPSTGPFGSVFLAAVQQGILPRNQAIELAFFALDAAVRPGDKKVWLQSLNSLSITDSELLDKVHMIIPLIANEKNTTLNHFTTRLLPLLNDDLLIELLIATFSTSHKKSLQQILKTAILQNRPENAQNLAPWLSHLVEHHDRPITNLIHTLSERWQIILEKQDEPIEQKGLWRETPDVWQVPTFEIGEVSKEALLNHISLLYARSSVSEDIHSELFLATLIALAYQDEDEARQCFVGIKPNNGVFDFVHYWFEGFLAEPWHYKQRDVLSLSPMTARRMAIQPFIGKLPCLLSTPSKWDLSISLPDLVTRMQRYQQAQLVVVEADLWVALGRLDLSTVTSDLSDMLETLNLPVKLPNNDIISNHAGQVVLNYIQNPIKEPPIDFNQSYLKATFDLTETLPDLPKRTDNLYYCYYMHALFPLMGDACLFSMSWLNNVDNNLGLILHQIVRRAHPLPPGGAINLLSAQRLLSGHSDETKFTAVTEAWKRGLLRPNIADVRFLDWTSKEPSHLVLFVNALERIAEEGLLSVVWPILDDLVVVSLNASRLLSGTAEIVQLILTLLPEVELAIDKKLTDISAFDLPGVRALANKGGQSKAVRTAQNIVAVLPKPEISENKIEKKTVTLAENSQVCEQTFAQIWYCPENLLPYLDDGVEITIDWQNSDKKERPFVFMLTLPYQCDDVFEVSTWGYDLLNKNQLDAYRISKSEKDAQLTSDNNVWLYWDESSQRLAYSQCKNLNEDKSLYMRHAPLSSTLLVIRLALLAQNNAGDYYSLNILSEGIEEGSMTAETVLKSVEILLQHPVINPSKLVRSLETDAKHLSTLWPILTQTIKAVGSMVSTKSPPVWINRILDIAIRHASYLKMAMEKGLIPEPFAKWPGLDALAQAKGKSVAIAKAQRLIGLLGL